MDRIVWTKLLRCACAFAGASCADALGLHDLLQGGDGGNGEAAESTSWIEGGGDSAAVSVPLGASYESIDDAGRAEDADVPAASALDAAPNDAAGSDALDGAIHDAAGSDTPVVDAAQRISDAALRDAGDDDANCSGCQACTVHSNGVGQRFQDCVRNGTHNAAQARAACAAFTGDSASCSIQSCPGGAVGAQLGEAKGAQAACSTGASVCDCWTYAGGDVGLVQSTSLYLCVPCRTGGTEWN
jgi:hypothetical protein